MGEAQILSSRAVAAHSPSHSAPIPAHLVNRAHPRLCAADDGQRCVLLRGHVLLAWWQASFFRTRATPLSRTVLVSAPPLIPPLPLTPGAPYAFIEFEDRRDAEDAMHALHGRTVFGRRIRVEMAKPRPIPGVTSRPAQREGGEGREGAPGGNARTKWRVLVTNLHPSVSWQDLKVRGGGGCAGKGLFSGRGDAAGRDVVCGQGASGQGGALPPRLPPRPHTPPRRTLATTWRAPTFPLCATWAAGLLA